MDIERNEANALTAATRLLEKIRPIWIIELHGQMGEDSVKRLYKAGYEIVRIGERVEATAELFGGGSQHIVAIPCQ